MALISDVQHQETFQSCKTGGDFCKQVCSVLSSRHKEVSGLFEKQRKKKHCFIFFLITAQNAFLFHAGHFRITPVQTVSPLEICPTVSHAPITKII